MEPILGEGFRMAFTRSAFLTGVSALLAGPAVAATAAEIPLSTVDPIGRSRGTPDEALRFLIEGNRRFRIGGQRLRPRPSDATPQRPWAALLTCADTRVAPEIVFDTGFGDVFVCRTAGNIADNDVTGSIEYAVSQFHAPLVVVIGHSGCGACEAAIKTFDGKPDYPIPPASIVSVVPTIMPAVSRIPRDAAGREALVEQKNAQLTAQALAAGPILAPAIASGRLRVTGAYHELHLGLVTIH
ncbi:MAG TPA: carbonic anhydrase [Candidatus Limnocylindrales bacterium]|nr:carbonic anhydrase [Candidatus Limnocylindrales bacterium]